MKLAAIRIESQIPSLSIRSEVVADPNDTLPERPKTFAMLRAENLVRCFPLISYVALTMALSWSIFIFLYLSGINPNLRSWKLLYVAGLSGPFFASVGIVFLLDGANGVWNLIRRAFLWNFSPLLYLTALFLPPVLMLGAAAICARLQQPTALQPVSPQIVTLTLLVMVLRGGPANEELGWRGFLLPRLLQRHSPFLATCILIPIWAAWHWPLWLLAGLPHPFWPFGYFFMLLAPMAFLFTWLHLHAKGSVLVAILFHASINTAIQFIPMLPPRHPGLAPFGVWNALTWAIALLIVWKGRDAWFSRP